jgi:hypothetical protein
LGELGIETNDIAPPREITTDLNVVASRHPDDMLSKINVLGHAEHSVVPGLTGHSLGHDR